MSLQEYEEITRITRITQQKYINQNREGGLVKPNVPDGINYEINKLVVEKLWRIICIKELHAFYTQEKLQTLVNRVCKHNYQILMKSWVFLYDILYKNI
jgi:hypothetical protein